jgi:hypothetical protein
MYRFGSRTFPNDEFARFGEEMPPNDETARFGDPSSANPMGETYFPPGNEQRQPPEQAQMPDFSQYLPPEIPIFTPQHQMELDRLKQEQGPWPTLLRQMAKNLTIMSAPQMASFVEQQDQQLDADRWRLENLKFEQAKRTEERQAAIAQMQQKWMLEKMQQAGLNKRAEDKASAEWQKQEREYQLKAELPPRGGELEYLMLLRPELRAQAIAAKRQMYERSSAAGGGGTLAERINAMPKDQRDQLLNTIGDIAQRQGAFGAQGRMLGSADSKLVQTFDKALEADPDYFAATLDPTGKSLEQVEAKIAAQFADRLKTEKNLSVSPQELLARIRQAREKLWFGVGAMGGATEPNE